MSIHIIPGDITTFQGDALVNAANNVGLGGGGVDGAIHKAAGPRLLQACEALPILPGVSGLGPGMVFSPFIRIPTGCAIPTPAFNLPCRWVIHTAGPVWTNNPHAETLLADCYRKPILVALGMGLKSIAFPAISTGVYGCPQEDCARIALTAIQDAPLYIAFYCFPEHNAETWQKAAQQLGLST